MSEEKINIQNKALQGTTLRLGAHSYTGDEVGIFACRPRDAERVLNTPGWSKSDKAPSKRTEADPTAKLRRMNLPKPAPPPVAAKVDPEVANKVLATPKEDRKPTDEQRAAQKATADTLAKAKSATASNVVKAAKAKDDAEKAAEADKAADALKAVEESESADEEEDIDFDSMDKKALVALAATYDVKLSAKQKKLALPSLRKLLSAEIYEEEDGS